ncbi:MAG: DUF4446 family protein [bacterium]
MGDFWTNFQPYLPYIVLADTFLVIILLFLLIIVLSKIKNTNRLLSWLSEGERIGDVRALLQRQRDFIAEVEENFKLIEKKLEELEVKQLNNIQKVGFLRFDAFKDIGGELSFSLALLNGKNEGIVVSSLHGREGSRVYAKTVKDGTSSFPLSDEEKEAIKRALGE